MHVEVAEERTFRRDGRNFGERLWLGDSGGVESRLEGRVFDLSSRCAKEEGAGEECQNKEGDESSSDRVLTQWICLSGLASAVGGGMVDVDR